MATWLRNTNCPSCGSKDNLAEYDDGSAWCWGCHHYRRPQLSSYINVRSKKPAIKEKVSLPEDAVDLIPKKALDWISKYHLTNEEFSKVKPLYSYERDLFIFPVYDFDGTLLMWQGRYFGNNPKHPKYLTRGAKDVLHIVGDQTGDAVVLTEDLISAIKVGTVINAMPLWGSSMPLGTLRKLSDRFKCLVLWLDMDKAKESLVFRSKFQPWFEQVFSLVTPKDPKEYLTDEIRRLLNEEIPRKLPLR